MPTLFRCPTKVIIKSILAIMSSDQIVLDGSGCFGFDGDLSVLLPSWSTQVQVIRSADLDKSRATFNRVNKNSLFTDEHGDTHERLVIEPRTKRQLEFVGGELEVNGPGIVRTVGERVCFEGEGTATYDMRIEPNCWIDNGVEKFGKSVRSYYGFRSLGGEQASTSPPEPDIFTIELCPAHEDFINLQFEGEGIDFTSQPDLPLGHVGLTTKTGGVSVHDATAQSIDMTSTSGTLKVEGSKFGRYGMRSKYGDIHGLASPTGKGTIDTDSGTVFAEAPRVSETGSESNTLAISTRGSAIIRVPNGYKGSVSGTWNPVLEGICTVDGSLRKGKSYEEGAVTRDGVSIAATGGGKIYLSHHAVVEEASVSSASDSEDAEEGGVSLNDNSDDDWGFNIAQQ